jgi:DNA-binding NarL/FixJ family response regulator
MTEDIADKSEKIQLEGEIEKDKVIIVDDNDTFREGIKFYLENILSFEVIALLKNGEDFLESGNMNKADVILMDIEMPKLNGIKTTKMALWQWKSLCIIAITSYQDKAYLSEFLGAGFRGCVFKENIYQELDTAIKTVLNGQYYYPKNMNL